MGKEEITKEELFELDAKALQLNASVTVFRDIVKGIMQESISNDLGTNSLRKRVEGIEKELTELKKYLHY